MAEEFRNVSVVFAEDHKNNIYKIARFTEKGLGDEYEFWSHIGDMHGYSCDSPYGIRKDEHFFHPIKSNELQSYMQGLPDIGSRRVTQMLRMAKFSIPIKAFHHVQIESDIAYGFQTFEHSVITGSRLGYESVLPEKNEQLSLEGENSEFYARTCAKRKDGRQKEIVHFSHEYTSEWDWNHNQVKSMYVDNEFLFSCLLKEARMRYLRNENVEFEPLDEAIVIGWTYADETKCKLTPDGIHYTKIYNTED